MTRLTSAKAPLGPVAPGRNRQKAVAGSRKNHERMMIMKQAIFLHTNAYDAILLPNGTFKLVDRDTFIEFGEAQLSIGPYNWDEWKGTESWTDFAATMEGAAEKMIADGAEQVAYYEDGQMVIENEKRLAERCEFYGFNIIVKG